MSAHIDIRVDRVPGTVLYEVTAHYESPVTHKHYQSETLQGAPVTSLVRQAVESLMAYFDAYGLDPLPEQL